MLEKRKVKCKMPHIKIKELSVSGDNVITSSIKFGNKLTIIAGPSDTGKSYIYKCIDYIFGASNDSQHMPLDLQEGYDTIKLIISNDYGNLSLTRKLKSNVTIVQSSIDGIESGDYLLNETKKNNKTINNLFLKLINTSPNLKLPKNNSGQTASFTWRTIKQAFMIDEQSSDKSESILLTSQGTTLYIASLIYLISDNTLSEHKGDEESEIVRKAKRNALINYIKNQRVVLEDKKKKFEEQITGLGNEKSFNERVQDLSAKLIEINQRIDLTTANNQTVSKSLIRIQGRLNKNTATMSRYHELKTQYDTDINRLTFIVENETLLKNKGQNTKCPFCDNSIVPHDHSSYIVASRAELVRLVNNLNELESTRIEMKNQIDDDSALVQDYKEQITEFNKLINQELIPQRNEVSAMLQDYKEYMQIEGAMKYIKDYDSIFEEDIKKFETESVNGFTPFNAKEMLFNLIGNVLQENSRKILSEIGYEPLNEVILDKQSLDLVINGKNKNAHGKGYKAFINSVLLLSFVQYMAESSVRNPGFYIFDSPLKGLNLPEGEVFTKNIRVGYFNYLTNLKTDSQLIVLENTDDHELPKINSNDDTIIYEFTQNENKGRYGFLYSLKRK